MTTTEAPRAPRQPKQQKAHQSKVHDIRLHLNIAEHDLNTKLGQVQKFLAKRDQVRVTVQLRGRERGRPESGLELLRSVVERVAEFGTPNAEPKVNPSNPGNIAIVFNPKKR